MHGLKTLAAALRQNADQIDNGFRPLNGGCHRCGITQIRLHGLNLAHAPQRLQMAGQVRAPGGDAHPPAALGQRAHHIAAKKAAAAEDDRQAARRVLRFSHVKNCM